MPSGPPLSDWKFPNKTNRSKGIQGSNGSIYDKVLLIEFFGVNSRMNLSKLNEHYTIVIVEM